MIHQGVDFRSVVQKKKRIREDAGSPSLLVARTLDSTNSGTIWDKFKVFQGHRSNTPYIQIGRKGGKSHDLKLEKHPNAIKQALQYQGLLDPAKLIPSRNWRGGHAPHAPRFLPISASSTCLRRSALKPSAWPMTMIGSPSSQRPV